jgi:diacylglycerol kinase (ATP)
MPTKIPRPKSQIDSFRYAIEGIVHVFRTQKHMRFHFFAVVLVLIAGMLSHFSTIEMILLVIPMGALLGAEMFNTAVETTVDLVTQTYHPLAKLAKDIAAGAVLVFAIVAGLVVFMLFFGSQQIAPLTVSVNRDPIPLEVFAVLFLLLFVIVMIVKVVGGKGSILSGGIVSGHAAVSFFLAVTLIYRTKMDPVTFLLAFLLALLVVQSRVEGKIHTVQEVVLGGLLGFCLTAGIYYFHIAPRLH